MFSYMPNEITHRSRTENANLYYFTKWFHRIPLRRKHYTVGWYIGTCFGSQSHAREHIRLILAIRSAFWGYVSVGKLRSRSSFFLATFDCYHQPGSSPVGVGWFYGSLLCRKKAALIGTERDSANIIIALARDQRRERIGNDVLWYGLFDSEFLRRRILTWILGEFISRTFIVLYWASKGLPWAFVGYAKANLAHLLWHRILDWMIYKKWSDWSLKVGHAQGTI